MPYQALIKSLTASGIESKKEVAIAPYTTFRIGGLADILCITKDSEQLHNCITICQAHNTPFKVLGGGSNVLVSDKGFRGVIIINKAKGWEIIDENTSLSIKGKTKDRHEALDSINPLEEGQRKVLVRVASGTKIPTLMNTLFTKDISGLELFAGIPATVGGAIYMNMHGAKLFFGDLLVSAKILTNTGAVVNVPRSYFEFDYDYSILHQTKDTVLSCDLLLTQGQSQSAKVLAKAWIKQKKIQPQRSAGCLFQNLTSVEQKKLGYPTPSIGYVIDKILQLKGTTIGGAKISEMHAAFIENTGNAKAADVLALINKIKKEAWLQTGIQLVPEIEFIGETE